MDADTRARLADALATATPAQLREDAAFIANAQTLLGNNDERFLRLAALALAVATMQELDMGVTIPADEAPHLREVYIRYDFTTMATAPTLPAALAALIRPEGA